MNSSSNSPPEQPIRIEYSDRCGIRSLTPWQWGGSVVRPTEGSTEALNSLRYEVSSDPLYSTRWIYNGSTDWPWNKVFILHLKAQFWLVVQEVISNWDSPPNLKLTSYPMWVRIELTSSNLIGSWKEVSLRLGGEFELELTSWTTNQNWVFRQMRNKIGGSFGVTLVVGLALCSSVLGRWLTNVI